MLHPKSRNEISCGLHAIVNAMITVKEGHDLAHKLKDRLQKELPELGHVLIHVEPEGEVVMKIENIIKRV
jgi:divalent metal cation (Fe/Co/Zn/Cd) transporter